jgi:hypothetical protein
MVGERDIILALRALPSFTMNTVSISHTVVIKVAVHEPHTLDEEAKK